MAGFPPGPQAGVPGAAPGFRKKRHVNVVSFMKKQPPSSLYSDHKRVKEDD